MKPKNVAKFALCALALTACSGGDAGAPDADTSAERDAVQAELSSAMGDKQTHVDDAAALGARITQLVEEFKDPSQRKAALARFEKASEHVDRLQLFLLARLGKTWLKDQVVLSDQLVLSTFRERQPADSASDLNEGLGSTSQALSSHPPSEVQENQGGVYKTRGESFVDNFLAYKQAGALTQFKKHRRRFGFTGWYDTDATKIAVQVYYFGNPDRDAFPTLRNTSYAMSEGEDHTSNDDYVSEREMCFGGVITYQVGPGAGPTTLTPNFTVGCYEGVYALHAVDHAGFKWRLTSSNGLRPELDWGSVQPAWHVPWET